MAAAAGLVFASGARADLSAAQATDNCRKSIEATKARFKKLSIPPELGNLDHDFYCQMSYQSPEELVRFDTYDEASRCAIAYRKMAAARDDYLQAVEYSCKNLERAATACPAQDAAKCILDAAAAAKKESDAAAAALKKALDDAKKLREDYERKMAQYQQDILKLRSSDESARGDTVLSQRYQRDPDMRTRARLATGQEDVATYSARLDALMLEKQNVLAVTHDFEKLADSEITGRINSGQGIEQIHARVGEQLQNGGSLSTTGPASTITGSGERDTASAAKAAEDVSAGGAKPGSGLSDAADAANAGAKLSGSAASLAAAKAGGGNAGAPGGFLPTLAGAAATAYGKAKGAIAAATGAAGVNASEGTGSAAAQPASAPAAGGSDGTPAKAAGIPSGVDIGAVGGGILKTGSRVSSGAKESLAASAKRAGSVALGSGSASDGARIPEGKLATAKGAEEGDRAPASAPGTQFVDSGQLGISRPLMGTGQSAEDMLGLGKGAVPVLPGEASPLTDDEKRALGLLDTPGESDSAQEAKAIAAGATPEQIRRLRREHLAAAEKAASSEAILGRDTENLFQRVHGGLARSQKKGLVVRLRKDL